MLYLKDKQPDTRDRLTWRWLKGSATQRAEFGDPITTTEYELCVFDELGGVPSVALEAHIPAGVAWKTTTRGYKYKDKSALARGVHSIVLKQGVDGASSIIVKGKASNLTMPALPLSQDTKVTVQFSNENACWEGNYSTNTSNEAGQFKARSD